MSPWFLPAVPMMLCGMKNSSKNSRSSLFDVSCRFSAAVQISSHSGCFLLSLGHCCLSAGSASLRASCCQPLRALQHVALLIPGVTPEGGLVLHPLSKIRRLLLKSILDGRQRRVTRVSILNFPFDVL